MHKELDKLVGSNLEDFQKGIVSAMKGAFSLHFHTANRSRFVENLVGRSFGDFEAMFKATKKAIVELRKTVNILRCFALCERIEAYSREHTGNMPEKERIGLLKSLEYDPKELKREWEAEPVIHHQLLDGRVFRTFGTHSVRFWAGYPLKNAMTASRCPKFAETPCDVSVSEHTSATGRKIMP